MKTATPAWNTRLRPNRSPNLLSARPVERHLRKVVAKLGITSRRELRAALLSAPGPADP